MSDWLPRVAQRFSLQLGTRHGRLLARRRDVTVEIEGLPKGCTPDEKHAIWASLLGVRLAIDRLTTTFLLADERPPPQASDKKHESPSLYGDRMLWLVPKSTVLAVQALCDTDICAVPWREGFASVFVNAWKKEWHVFAEEDFAYVDFDAANLQDFARYALFNDEKTQKPRPVVETLPFGKIRRYEATDGLMASRGVLMPDYDWDAAAVGGCFCLPSRDVMLVGEPCEKGDERIYFEVAAQAREIWAHTDFPFSGIVFQIKNGDFQPGACQWHTKAQGIDIQVRRV